MLIVVFGLPGTGKSFFSQYLKDEINADHLSSDRVRDEMNKKGEYDEKSKNEVYKHLMGKAEVKLKEGTDIIVDGTFHKQERRDLATDVAGRTGHRIFFIQIKASAETVKKRLKKSREDSEADFKIYKKLEKEFDPCLSQHLTLWSDCATISQMIIKAKNYIYGYPTDTCPDG